MSRRLLLLSAAGLLPLAGLAQTAAAPAPSAAIVPGADAYFSFDLAGARKSPLFQELEKKDQKPEMAAKMKAATGLDKEDVLRFSGSVDIDSLKFDGEGPDPEQMANLPAVLQIQLAKAVTRDQFRKGLELVSAENEDKPSVVTDAGDGLLKITPKEADADAKDGMYAGLSGDGKQVMLGGNVKSVQDALARAASGKLQTLSPALAAMSSNTSQMQLAVLLPQAAKDGIAKAVDEATKNPDPGAIMMAGMLAPLKGLSKVAVRANFNPADLALMFLADLSTPDFATQANMLLNTMVIPMVAQGLGQDPSKPPRIQVAAQGAVLTLKGSLSKDELLNMGKGGPGGLDDDADFAPPGVK